MGRTVAIPVLVVVWAACGDDDVRCQEGARICRSNTVWVCTPDGAFVPERTCHESNVCVDGACTPALQPDGFDTVGGDTEIIETAPDTTVDTTDTAPDTAVDTIDTAPDTAVDTTDTAPDTTDTTVDTTPDTTVDTTETAPDTTDTTDTTPDTTVDTTPDTDVGPQPEAPPGLLGYERVGNVVLRGDLIRVAWDPSGEFAYVLGAGGDLALYRPGSNLIKVGKVGSAPTDMVVVPTEAGHDLVVLDATLGLLRTRLTDTDALAPHTATTFPQGSPRAIAVAPAASPHAGKFAIATQASNSNYISYLYLWHPDSGLTPVKGFNAGAGVTDLMWGDPQLYANEPWLLTTHGLYGADSKAWIISSNEVVANGWSPGFGNAGQAAWRPDPTRASGLGTYGLVGITSTNALRVFDGAWRSATLPTPNNGGTPQGIAWKSDGSRALIVGRVTGAAPAATVIEHRPTSAAWSESFVNQSITGFTSAPWSGTTSQYLTDVAWRPGTACDEGLIVGQDNGTAQSPTFGYAIRFVDLDDPACR